MNNIYSFNSNLIELIEIESIEHIHHVNGVDIEVEEDHTFTLANGIISHNSAARSMQSARNPEIHGIYPLKGNPLNVRGMALIDLLENKELAELMKIIGLEFGKEYKISQLRYSQLVIASDQDLHGFRLCGLIINLFNELWPSLVKQGFLYKLQTPIVRVTQNKKEIEFMYIDKFHEWESKQTAPYSAHYLKGLGSNDTKYFKQYLSKPEYKLPILFVDNEDQHALDIAFDKKKAGERKQFIYGDIS